MNRSYLDKQKVSWIDRKLVGQILDRKIIGSIESYLDRQKESWLAGQIERKLASWIDRKKVR